MATSELIGLCVSAASDACSIVGSVDATHPPVFLHTGWRTGGTWFWSRFRTLPGVRGYYEPLHPELGLLDRARIDRDDSKLWDSGHPALHAPYFEEYRPLLNDGGTGVRLFHSRFAAQSFFAPAHAELPGLSDYLREILRNAEDQGRQPVLKFCRSLGRLAWMQRHFPDAVHVVLLRNPLEQFASARSQFIRLGNEYFLAMPYLLLALHQNDPLVAFALQSLDIKLPCIGPGRGSWDALHIWEGVPVRIDLEELYRVYLAFWILTAVGIPKTIDLIINYDTLKRSRSYRQACEAELLELTGLSVALDDVQSGDEHHLLDRVGLSRNQLWRCHRAAEAILVECGGIEWCGQPNLALAGALLAHATLLATDGSATLHATAFEQLVRWDDLTVRAATAASCTLRAVQAERRAERAEQQLAQVNEELAAVYSSRSWALTAPLRRLRECLPRG